MRTAAEICNVRCLPRRKASRRKSQNAPTDPATSAIEELPGFLDQAAQLWDSVRPPGPSLLSPEAKRRRAEKLLGDWLAVALERRGFRPLLRPGQVLALVKKDGGGQAVWVEPQQLIERLRDGRLSGEEYQRWCRTV